MITVLVCTIKRESFGSKGSDKGQFTESRGVAITSDNHILVADTSNHRIQMLTLKGNFVRFVGKKGDEPLEFDSPSDIAVHPSDGSVCC